MRLIREIEADIKALKKERKDIKKEYGKHSVVYAVLTEELDGLKDELEFSKLYMDE